MEKVTIEFEIDIDCDEDPVHEDRRYIAHCRRLPWCTARARSEADALEKMAQAIDMWLDIAQRHFRDEPGPMRAILNVYS